MKTSAISMMILTSSVIGCKTGRVGTSKADPAPYQMRESETPVKGNELALQLHQAIADFSDSDDAKALPSEVQDFLALAEENLKSTKDSDLIKAATRSDGAVDQIDEAAKGAYGVPSKNLDADQKKKLAAYITANGLGGALIVGGIVSLAHGAWAWDKLAALHKRFPNGDNARLPSEHEPGSPERQAALEDIKVKQRNGYYSRFDERLNRIDPVELETGQMINKIRTEIEGGLNRVGIQLPLSQTWTNARVKFTDDGIPFGESGRVPVYWRRYLQGEGGHDIARLDDAVFRQKAKVILGAGAVLGGVLTVALGNSLARKVGKKQAESEAGGEGLQLTSKNPDSSFIVFTQRLRAIEKQIVAKQAIDLPP